MAAQHETLPSRRLGTLLAEVRVARARSLDVVAASTPFDAVEIGRIESGDRVLTPSELDTVLDAYGVTLDELMPSRAQVVVDLEARALVVAGETARLAREPTADDVLVAYLSLVYTLRRAQPGRPIVLRDFDVAVLARGLDLARPDVDRRLRSLMVATGEGSTAGPRSRRRLVLLVVAVLALAGLLLGVLARRSDDPAPGAPSASTVPPASIIPPAVVTNDGEGTSVD